MHKSKLSNFSTRLRTKTDDNASYDVMSPVIYIKYLEEPRVHGLRKKKKSRIYNTRRWRKTTMSGKVQELLKKEKKSIWP